MKTGVTFAPMAPPRGESAAIAKEPEDTAASRAGLAAAILAAFILRFWRLGAWPLVQADEGLWTSSTKNFLMFGDWFMDGRRHVLLSPVFHVATLPVFKTLGASIASARFVSAVAGALSVWLLYLLVRELTANRSLAITAALVFALDQSTVFIARTSLIESTELAPLLAAAYFTGKRGLRSAAIAGVCVAIALLTKLNCVFMLPVLALFMVIQARSQQDEPWRRTMARIALVGGLGAGLAALAYYAEYATEPARFVAAFRFELDGVHFEAASNPLIRVGRFAFDPALIGRTAIDLFRESPFLYVLGAIGFGLEFSKRSRRATLFAIWLLAGGAFLGLQMYQPVRYFYLVAPAVAFFGACTIHRLSGVTAPDGSWGPRSGAAFGVFALFSVAYVVGGFVKNPERRIPVVVDWVVRSTEPSDRIMTSEFLAVGMPRRAYGHYYYAFTDSATLVRSLRTLQIDYIVADDSEWHPAQRAWLAAHYPVVQRWAFGEVYRVGTDSAGGKPPQGPDAVTPRLELSRSNRSSLGPRTIGYIGSVSRVALSAPSDHRE